MLRLSKTSRLKLLGGCRDDPRNYQRRYWAGVCVRHWLWVFGYWLWDGVVMMELNLSIWIDRRKENVGPYADWIIEHVKGYEARIEQLESENHVYLIANNEHLRDRMKHVNRIEQLERELAAEKALADDYQEALEDISKNWAQEMYLADMLYKAFGNDDDFANQADAAYRKARGLQCR